MIRFLILIFLIGIDTAGGSNMLTTLLGLGDTKLNPDILTNVMSVAGIVQGMLLMLAPTLSLKMYGTDDTSLYLRVHAEFVGAAVLTCGVCCLCLFVLHLDAMKTLGFASLVWAAEHVKVLVNEYPTKLGYSRNGHIVWLLFSIAIIQINALIQKKTNKYSNFNIKISFFICIKNIIFYMYKKYSQNM